MSIHTLDLRYLDETGSIASYIIDAPDGPVMVETGPGSTTNELERGLATLGHRPSDVRDVLVSHIHFDHAGAAGWMARHGARVHVHEFGAKHLVDPSRLLASAQRIYGDRMGVLWGDILPIPEAQVVPVHDGDVLRVGGLQIRALETPGHARHHHAYILDSDAGKVTFTGDAAACFIAARPEFISVPTPPPEFDLEAWRASLGRLRAEQCDALYPTHFGAVADPAAHLDRVERTLIAHTDFVMTRHAAGVDETTLRAAYLDWFVDGAVKAGVPDQHLGFYVKRSLADMNVSGILRYLARAEPKTVSP